MDLPDIKKSLLNTRKAFTQPQSDPKKSKDIEIHASVSSLASKLSKAKSSIDISKLSQQNLSLHKEVLSSNAKINNDEVATAKWEFEHLSKSKLETIALDTSNTFSSSERVAAYERWHTLDQQNLSNLKRDSLKYESNVTALASFEELLSSHTNSFSFFSKAMVSDEYSSQATSQFESILDARDLEKSKNISRSEHYYETMVMDIFGGTESEILSGTDGMSLSNLMRSSYEFLTQGDRELLADIYEYADNNNIDFKYIRQFASDLGGYRMHDDGKILNNFNNGHFNGEGYQLAVSFTDKDQATINNILDSQKKLSSSDIDGGFISFMTEPGLSALSHRGSYQFLQYMIEIKAGIEPSLSTENFKVFEGFSGVDARYVITTSDKRLIRPEPDVICKNGTCEVTEKGHKNNVTLEENKGNPILDLKSNSISSLLELRVNNTTENNTLFQWLAD